MKRATSFCIIALILALLISGCAAGYGKTDTAGSSGSGAAPRPSSAPPGSAQSSSAPAAASPPPGGAGGTASDSAGGSGAQWEPGAEGSMGTLPILTPSNSRGLRYVYTIDLKLQTTSFMAGIRTLLSTIGRMEGYVESADVHGRDLHVPPHERDAEYTFRLYTERLADFIEVIEDNYNILSLKQRSENVTGDYEYGDSAIDDFRRQEARLLTALENTRLEAQDRLDLEKQLANVQSSIRYYEREQIGYDDGILYSTIKVQLFEVIFPEVVEEVEEEIVVEPEPTFGERFREAASRSWKGFTAFCQGLLIVLIRIAPVVFIILVLAVIGLLVYRGVRRAGRKRDAASAGKMYGLSGKQGQENITANGGHSNKDDKSGQ